MQHHKPDCHAEKLVYCVQYQSAGLFANKLGLIVQHHKLECPVEKWDYFVYGQGHREGSEYQ